MVDQILESHPISFDDEEDKPNKKTIAGSTSFERGVAKLTTLLVLKDFKWLYKRIGLLHRRHWGLGATCVSD